MYNSLQYTIHACFASDVDCTDGEVRLVGNSNPLSGRVEVCYDRVWGIVCSSFWNSIDASVICRQLGHATAGNGISCMITLVYIYELTCLIYMQEL